VHTNHEPFGQPPSALFALFVRTTLFPIPSCLGLVNRLRGGMLFANHIWLPCQTTNPTSIHAGPYSHLSDRASNAANHEFSAQLNCPLRTPKKQLSCNCAPSHPRPTDR
jgi:hypothetical protein